MHCRYLYAESGQSVQHAVLFCTVHGFPIHCRPLKILQYSTSGELMHNAKISAVHCKSLHYQPMRIILAVCGVHVAVVGLGGGHW